MREIIEQIFARNAEMYAFKDERDKEKVFRELENRFHGAGDKVVNKVNGVPIDSATFERILYSVAQPFIKSPLGKLIPRFIDGRSAAQKQQHKDEINAIVDLYLEKMGYVFIGEHLDDQTNRNTVKNLIAEQFVYEGLGPEGEIHFRKFTGGMFSTAWKPEEVINHFAGQFLDHKRTEAQQLGMRMKTETEVLKKYGYVSMKKVPPNIKDIINEEINELITPVAYSKKRIAYDEREYAEEFEKFAAHRFGIVNPKAANHQQILKIDAFRDRKLEELNSLPRIEAKPVTKFEEPANIPFQNTKGVPILIEQAMAEQ